MVKRECVLKILPDQVGFSDAAAPIYGHELSFLTGHDFVKCLDFFSSSNHLFSPKWRHCTKMMACQSSMINQNGDKSVFGRDISTYEPVSLPSFRASRSGDFTVLVAIGAGRQSSPTFSSANRTALAGRSAEREIEPSAAGRRGTVVCFSCVRRATRRTSSRCRPRRIGSRVPCGLSTPAAERRRGRCGSSRSRTGRS